MSLSNEFMGLLTVLGVAAVPVLAADLTWHDATTLTVAGRGWAEAEAPYHRLPQKAQGVVRPDVWNLSTHSAGLEVRFVTASPRIAVRWKLTNGGLAMPHMPATGVSGVDLYAFRPPGPWRFVGNGRPAAQENEATFWALPGATEYRLYLPLYNGVSAVQIGVEGDAKLDPAPAETAKAIVWYGTSIVQGGCASRPGNAATAMLGRLLGRPVINLGFSGNGKMEPELADLLAELDPAVYLLDCLWNMSDAEVRERVVPFVQKLRAARPTTPIVLAEDSQAFDQIPTAKGKILRELHAQLVKDGVTGLTLLSAKGMLGADGDGTVDGCHPNDLGFARQADVFAAAVRPLLANQP